jgi:AraC-like DNA-binding protein
MNTGFWDKFDEILSLVPAHQGLMFFVIFVSLFLYHKKNNYKQMAIYKLSIFSYFLLSYFYTFGSIEMIVWLFYVTLPITFLVLPSFYLYIESITSIQPIRFNKKIKHFFPSILWAVLLLPYLFIDSQTRFDFINYGFKNQDIHSVLFYLKWIFRIGVYFILTGQIIAYFVLFYKLIKKNKKNIENLFSYTENINLQWLKIFIGLFMFFFILSFFALFAGANANIVSRFFINILFALINLYLGIRAIIQPNIYSLLRDKEKLVADFEIIESTPTIESDESKRKYSGSSLTDEYKSELIEKLEDFLLEKPHQNSKITIEDFAEHLGTNTRYLSQIINEHYGINFFTFINNFRIEEAKKILITKEGNMYTIEAIANMVGFHSKSSFNTSFKKLTGYTPSDFRNKNKNITS